MPDFPEAPVPRYVHGIFCEDIREEKAGTSSYIGVFPNVVAPSTPYPFVLPRIAAAFWLVCPVEDELPPMSLFLEAPESDPIALPALPAPAPEQIEQMPGAVRHVASGVIRTVNFTIVAPGVLRLRMHAWGGTWTVASLRFVAPAMSVVSPDPWAAA